MWNNPYLLLAGFFGLIALILIAWKMKWPKVFVSSETRKKTAIEDILKQLYHVEYGGKKATLNAMAGALKLNHGQLIELIEEMSLLGLIKRSSDVIELSDSGRDYALRIIRVHRLWEKYLSEKTGIHKSEWHQMAEKMEHHLNGKETETLYQALGSPRYDPHGDPIPMASGEIITSHEEPLSHAQAGAVVKITHIEDEPHAIYRQIIGQKLHMGQQLSITQSDDQYVQFTSEGEHYQLSTIVASNIGVKPLNTEEINESKTIRLSSLGTGEKARVIGISSECRGANRRRLLDFGFIKGTTIETEMESPTKEPKAYKIKNTLIALRNDQADLVLIEKEY